MTERGVGSLQFEKHTLSKGVYQRYETYNENMKPPKSNFLKKQIEHNLP